MRWTVVLAVLLFGLTVACSDDSEKSAQPTSLPPETVDSGEDVLPSPVSTETVTPEHAIQARPLDVETTWFSAHDASRSHFSVRVRFEPTPAPSAEITVEILEQDSTEVLAMLTRDYKPILCAQRWESEIFTMRGKEAEGLLSAEIFGPGPNPYQVRVTVREGGATQAFMLDLPSPSCLGWE